VLVFYFDRMVDKRAMNSRLFEDITEGDTAEFGRILRKVPPPACRRPRVVMSVRAVQPGLPAARHSGGEQGHLVRGPVQAARAESRVRRDTRLVDAGIVPSEIHRHRTKFRAEIDSFAAFLEDADTLHKNARFCMSLQGEIRRSGPGTSPLTPRAGLLRLFAAWREEYKAKGGPDSASPGPAPSFLSRRPP
jgi:hypothetical protein